MRSSLFAACGFSALAQLAFAADYAVLDPSKLPSCAFQCKTLVAGNDACVPPTAAVSSQNAYQACFCSAQSLTSLYSSPNLCEGTCSSSDAQKIMSWYDGLCTGGIVVTPSGSTPTGSSSGSSSSSSAGASQTSSAAGSAQSSGSSTSQNSSSNSSNANKSWISTHYGWIIFVILLALFIVLGLVGGLWLRRRNKRKVDQRRFSSNSHLPGPGSTSSPYDSGMLSSADGAFVGSRNHPQMTMVPDAGSEAAYERYSGYGAPPSSKGVSIAQTPVSGSASPSRPSRGGRGPSAGRRQNS